MSELEPVVKVKKPKRDYLCVLAVILGLAGVFPHAVDEITKLILAVRGATVAVAPPQATSNITSNVTSKEPIP